MRRLGLGLALILLVLAVASGVAALLALYLGGGPGSLSIGSIWYAIHPNSLVGFQGIVERGIDPDVWPPIQAVLVAPAWLTLAVPGLLLALLCWPRRPHLG